ncbi:MAG: hypothetical protein Q4C61_06540 [Lachnospiraceae bacterium]|nr:hypothetical protein [Lachnospiraceae bacterium]
MIEFILDYMETKGVYAVSEAEQQQIEQGISLYLLENGIEEDAENPYFRKYVLRHLKRISPSALKQYFIRYSVISEVSQIAIEQKQNGRVTVKRKEELYGLMEVLHQCGLGDTYIPAMEIKEILGGFS